MLYLVILIVSVLFVSAICSMTEAAILSLPLIKARILFEEKRKGANRKSRLAIQKNKLRH